MYWWAHSSRSQCLCVKTNRTRRSWTSWRRVALRRSGGFWATTSSSSNQVCYPECNRTNQSVMMMRIPVVTWVTSDLTEFSQGMILPTANRAKLPQPETKKSQIQTSKTQVDFSSPKPAKYSASGVSCGSDLWLWMLLQISSAPRCSSSPAPHATGVRISTCSFNLKETFQTSPDELYRTFINQEVPNQDRAGLTQLTRIKPGVTRQRLGQTRTDQG